ncbi:unnamed protein product [Choristocarpus tenellus]
MFSAVRGLSSKVSVACLATVGSVGTVYATKDRDWAWSSWKRFPFPLVDTGEWHLFVRNAVSCAFAGMGAIAYAKEVIPVTPTDRTEGDHGWNGGRRNKSGIPSKGAVPEETLTVSKYDPDLSRDRKPDDMLEGNGDVAISTTDELEGREEEEDEDTTCPFCLFQRRGPCGPEFRLWEKCIALAKEEDVDFVSRCAPATKVLMVCMEQHPSYYQVLDAKRFELGTVLSCADTHS